MEGNSAELLVISGTGKSRLWHNAWSIEDDWRGVTNPRERKKKQNRINQRTYRRKNAARKTVRLWVQSGHHSESPFADGASLLACSQRVAQIREATEAAYQAYILGVPGLTNLPVLIRLNVLHALARNATLIGFQAEGLCMDELVSSYSDCGPQLPHKSLPLATCPAALAPTASQRMILHHPWIDLFPFPSFRDRALNALYAGTLDEDELCLELLEVHGRDIEERPALIVWGDSSNPMAWEVSVSFLRKWGWLVQGCRELLESTNYWRGKRHERQLLLPVS